MKKIKSLLIATAVTAVAVVPVFANVSGLVSTSVSTSVSEKEDIKPSEEVYLKGDADNSGFVELVDAQLALKAALLIPDEKLTEKAKAAVDIDGSGVVELKDAQAVLKEALKITINWEARK